MKKVQRLSLLLSVLMVIFVILGCGTQTNNSAPKGSANNSQTTPNSASSPAPTPPTTDKNNPLVTITMADGGIIKAELYPNIAPNTVKNFISLVKKGFYNGLTFHRVIPGFMIQGGDPSGNGTGGPGYSIKGEFTNNGFKNDLKHTRGVLSMARTQDPNSAGSQFFIMVAAAPSLDGDYAAFGKVTSGMDEVDKIVNTPQDQTINKPLTAQVMKSVTVDTFGVNYGEPEVIKK
ncbi:peptidyl-prolyl cis-trans isomerase (rotamase) - cyclophilin family [Desulfosporosinus acidiphilus SJ4]|uniref:Peptidyl-prolyl cis-trans isomerase n=1 Tax=Desulfosporosinus acidiphilus (strain DSM 22704 / JCM 16185 / SJ4) TaxID=646529 RepID=I4D202_DESAJ|nr:peptidylprolyl isomerase [Desulfosporosinus acidiphilus]AFM39826.1 peptidyl-prolyl cis-trans isomerase (rotamase) - cyclophilin family [Desulfosporosinus acidiphilus SJ4]